jgi:hypothetical protein
LAKNFIQVFIDFLKTKDPAKLINYVIQWMSRVTVVSPHVQNAGLFAGDVKNFMSGSEGVSKFNDLVISVKKLWHTLWSPNASEEETAAVKRDVWIKLTDLMNSITDLIKLGHNRVASLSGIRHVEGIAAAATFSGSVVRLRDDYLKLRTDAAYEQQNVLNGLNMGMSASYLLVGLLSLLGYLLKKPMPAVLFFLSTALIFSIASFFFKNLVDPLGENRDPKKMQRALDDQSKQVSSLQGRVQQLSVNPLQQVAVRG